MTERTSDIVQKRDSDVPDGLEGEGAFWQGLAGEAMKTAWAKEDDIWDKLYRDDGKTWCG